jgi:hypothetical protein
MILDLELGSSFIVCWVDVILGIFGVGGDEDLALALGYFGEGVLDYFCW